MFGVNILLLVFFGFNSTNQPPNDAELHELHNMLYDLIIVIRFRKYSNQFQKKLKEDIKNISETHQQRLQEN